MFRFLTSTKPNSLETMSGIHNFFKLHNLPISVAVQWMHA